AGIAASPAASRVAWTQTYPSRYVRLVVPFAAGGGGDAIARPLANRLSEMWAQQVVIENRGGGGGNVGAQAVAQSAPDGYTILLGGGVNLATNPFLYPSIYNPADDLAPVTLVTIIPNLMMVPNSSPARSVREFIDYAKANRGKITFGSSGIGTSPHLAGELFKRMAGIEMTHVPYVDIMFSNLPGVLSQHQSGTIRGLAVTSAKRSPAAPEIPTIDETVPGYEVSGWWGLFVQAKTPRQIVAKLHSDAVAALEHPSVRQRYEGIGASVTTSTPAELAQRLASETEKWGLIIKEAGIKPD
ncbi:MAG: tripartite tricarboxylate transporter substrate binding protein, partial [Alphaproteobacteria bacterium]